MKNPFKRKNQEVTAEADENVNEKGKGTKPSFSKKVGKFFFKYKLSLNMARPEAKKEGESEDAPAEIPAEEAEEQEAPAAGQAEAAQESPAKTEKPKKEKKAKPSKEPKPKKAPKVKKLPKVKVKKEKGEQGEEGTDEKKGKLGLIIGIAAGVVALGGGAAAAILIMGSEPPTPGELLEKAADYTAKESYDKAESLYEQLMDEQDTLDSGIVAKVYLGLADTKLAASETPDEAISVLTQGLELTGDYRIQSKLDELRPEEALEENPAETGEESAAEESEASKPPDEPVVFADAAFERMIRQGLDKSDSQPIMKSELASIRQLKIIGGTHVAIDEPLNSLNSSSGYTIDQTLHTERGEITSLKDVVNFPALTKLVICYNHVSDLTGLEELTSLDTLGLYFNDITSLEPIRGLTSLRFLYIYNNSITSLEPVGALKELREMWVQNNHITNLSSIAELEKLEGLFVSGNEIADISPLSGMSSLILLYAADNSISDISAVANLPSLKESSFTGNPVRS